jgi:hypothetical protein
MTTTQIPLPNAGFDEGFYNFENVAEVSVPINWRPWWKQGTDKETKDGFFKRPEFKPELQRVRSGRSGIKWFTTFSTHLAGIYTQVAVPKGAPLIFKAWGQYWSEHTDGSGGALMLSIGIDPTGSINPMGNSIVWGEPLGQNTSPKWDGSTWRELQVAATAQAETVTLFLRSQCEWRAKHNDAYWDDVALYAQVDTPQPTGDIVDLLENILAESIEIRRSLAKIGGHLT